jgi:hypothetical protein
MEIKEPSATAAVLALVVQPEHIKHFIFFFTEGVTLPITTGHTLKETVCEQMGIAAAYFEERIQTIFLNFKAVDNPETALVKAGAVVALSAAMPGLVGATMRRGGVFANLRSSISFAETGGDTQQKKGLITLKLLNMVGRELGPAFLTNGVYLSGEQLADFIPRAPEDLKTGTRKVVLDAAVITWEQLSARDWSGQRVLLKVTAD